MELKNSLVDALGGLEEVAYCSMLGTILAGDGLWTATLRPKVSIRYSVMILQSRVRKLNLKLDREA